MLDLKIIYPYNDLKSAKNTFNMVLNFRINVVKGGCFLISYAGKTTLHL